MLQRPAQWCQRIRAGCGPDARGEADFAQIPSFLFIPSAILTHPGALFLLSPTLPSYLLSQKMGVHLDHSASD